MISRQAKHNSPVQIKQRHTMMAEQEPAAAVMGRNNEMKEKFRQMQRKGKGEVFRVQLTQ